MFNRIANSPDILQRFSIIWLYLIIPYIILYNSYIILITSSNNLVILVIQNLSQISNKQYYWRNQLCLLGQNMHTRYTYSNKTLLITNDPENTLQSNTPYHLRSFFKLIDSRWLSQVCVNQIKVFSW